MSDPIFRRSVAALEDARPRETVDTRAPQRRGLTKRAKITAYCSTWIDDMELPLAEILQKQPRAMFAAAVYLLDMAGLNEEALDKILDMIESHRKNRGG